MSRWWETTKTAAFTMIPDPVRRWRYRRSAAGLRRRYAGTSAAETFTDVYRTNGWGGEIAPSTPVRAPMTPRPSRTAPQSRRSSSRAEPGPSSTSAVVTAASPPGCSAPKARACAWACRHSTGSSRKSCARSPSPTARGPSRPCCSSSRPERLSVDQLAGAASTNTTTTGRAPFSGKEPIVVTDAGRPSVPRRARSTSRSALTRSPWKHPGSLLKS